MYSLQKISQIYTVINDFDAHDGLLMEKGTVARNPSFIYFLFFALHPLHTYILTTNELKSITRRNVFFSYFSLVCIVLFFF